jgi:hypothetical protein
MSSGAEVKGYLLGWICPVFVTDPKAEDYTYRPRLWGHLTIHFALWYCNVFRKDCPVVVPGETC